MFSVFARSRRNWKLDEGDNDLGEMKGAHITLKEPQKTEQNLRKYKETGDGKKTRGMTDAVAVPYTSHPACYPVDCPRVNLSS
jgi:hypothetical protein